MIKKGGWSFVRRPSAFLVRPLALRPSSRVPRGTKGPARPRTKRSTKSEGQPKNEGLRTKDDCYIEVKTALDLDECEGWGSPMANESTTNDAADTLRRINDAWLNGRVADLAPLVHPDIVMVFPGFAGRMQGRDAFVAGFEDFSQNAKIHEYRPLDLQIDVAGETAIATFRYEMVYERSGIRSRSTGRDLWVFENHGQGWMPCGGRCSTWRRPSFRE